MLFLKLQSLQSFTNHNRYQKFCRNHNGSSTPLLIFPHVNSWLETFYWTTIVMVMFLIKLKIWYDNKHKKNCYTFVISAVYKLVFIPSFFNRISYMWGFTTWKANKNFVKFFCQDINFSLILDTQSKQSNTSNFFWSSSIRRFVYFWLTNDLRAKKQNLLIS